jgi:hypothetical protein
MLLLTPGGGLNSTIAFFTGRTPFNTIEAFMGEYRCITMDLRHANLANLPTRWRSTGPGTRTPTTTSA